MDFSLRGKSLVVAFLLMEATTLADGAGGVSDDLVFWRNVRERILGGEVTTEERQELLGNLTGRLQTNPHLRSFLQDSVVRESSVEVRFFLATAFIMGLDAENVADCEVFLADSSSRVRQVALAAVGRHRLVSLASIIPASLLATNAWERMLALTAIRATLGPQGIMYYVQMLNDPDDEVAARAAVCLRSVDKGRVAPHLVEFLETNRDNPRRTPVVREALKSLYVLHELPCPSPLELSTEVDSWLNRLREGQTVILDGER